ncbi:MAG: transcription antitermination factor NusB [Candidatus Omnitrophica bacterium]|nr:transcription antitermination factor NusB [Candidatus Omnitrophota bacterium]
MRKRTRSREIALKILYAWDITGEPVAECRRKFWENNKSAEKEIVEFSDFLIFGVEKNLKRTDEIITGHALNWTLERMATIDRNVLRIASFELLFSAGTPPKVAINEAIDLAKKYGDRESGKFVNGILDKINRAEKDRACP